VATDYTFVNNFSNATVTKNGNTLSVSVLENETRDPRTGTITLIQTNSSKTLVLAISQNANPAIQNERHIAVGTMRVLGGIVQIRSYLTETSSEAYFGEEMDGDQNYPSMKENFYIPSEGYFKFLSSDSNAYFEIAGDPNPYYSGDIAYVPNEITSILIKH
jgi:hypothetical protein